jgi:chromate transporter
VSVDERNRVGATGQDERQRDGGRSCPAGVEAGVCRDAIVDWLSALLAVVAALLLIRFKVNSAWLVLGGGLVGFVAYCYDE